jgi:hypothetical protein
MAVSMQTLATRLINNAAAVATAATGGTSANEIRALGTLLQVLSSGPGANHFKDLGSLAAGAANRIDELLLG